MDTRTGQIVYAPNNPDSKHFVPVRRDLTEKERADRQIQLYAPCGCGSGKKFKFCCWTTAKATAA